MTSSGLERRLGPGDGTECRSPGSPGGCGGNRWVADGLCAGAGRPVPRPAERVKRETGRIPTLADRCAGEIVGPGAGTAGADPKCRATPGSTSSERSANYIGPMGFPSTGFFQCLGTGSTPYCRAMSRSRRRSPPRRCTIQRFHLTRIPTRIWPTRLPHCRVSSYTATGSVSAVMQLMLARNSLAGNPPVRGDERGA
jgi:hypothetical protein